jgi:hypothetical protein
VHVIEAEYQRLAGRSLFDQLLNNLVDAVGLLARIEIPG